MSVEIEAHLTHRKTDFQEIDIYDTVAFGRILTLDGHIQLAEVDEAVYHEFLVHMPLLSVDGPKSALVVGGGDGGVLRELCKYTSIEHIDMAEIDSGVVEESKEHLPFVSAGAFDDPRVHLHITDAFAFVKTPPRSYDLIVVDSTDVYEDEEGGISEALFTQEFYRDCLASLTEGGFLITQADNPVFCPYSLEHIREEFSAIFPVVGDYFAAIPSFGGYSAYAWVSKGAQLLREFPSDRAAGLSLKRLNAASYAFALTPPPGL